MKKRRLFLGALILMLILCAGARAEGSEDRDGALITMAQDAAERLTALCGTDSYIRLLTGNRSSEELELIHSWSGEWAQRENCRRAAVAFVDSDTLAGVFPSLLEVMGGQDGVDVSELLPFYDILVPRLISSLGSYLNAPMGNDWYISTSFITYSDIRVTDQVEEGCACVLLDYFGEGHPLVLATFLVKDDGALSVMAQFVPTMETTETLFDVASGSVDPRRLLSDALASAPPQPARAILDALDQLEVKDYYF